MTLFAEIAGARPAKSTPRDAVVEDLTLLCNVRRGSLRLAPDYGVDDVTFLFYSYPGGLEDWAARVQESLRMHEPRLRDVSVVALVGDALDLTLKVEIVGLLASGERAVPVRFATEIDMQCRLTVR